jgi:hypothetical protein
MKKEIIEGNKLIAEFMGVKSAEKGMVNIYMDGEIMREFGTEYHISWNELMPIVEKIELWQNGLCSFFIVVNECDIAFSDKYDIKGNELYAPNFKQKGKTKIEATWLAVVEFIKYYNLNKQK